jgi:hypothetical protein
LQHLSPATILQQLPLSQQLPPQATFGFEQHFPPTHKSVGLQHVLPHCLVPTPHLQTPLTHV